MLVDGHCEPPAFLHHEEEPPVTIVTIALNHASRRNTEAVIDAPKKTLWVICSWPRLRLDSKDMDSLW
jgi:hypothetical protein